MSWGLRTEEVLKNLLETCEPIEPIGKIIYGLEPALYYGCAKQLGSSE